MKNIILSFGLLVFFSCSFSQTRCFTPSIVFKLLESDNMSATQLLNSNGFIKSEDGYNKATNCFLYNYFIENKCGFTRGDIILKYKNINQMQLYAIFHTTDNFYETFLKDLKSVGFKFDKLYYSEEQNTTYERYSSVYFDYSIDIRNEYSEKYNKYMFYILTDNINLVVKK